MTGRRPVSVPAKRRGFTLLEVVLAVALIGLLVGGVYAVARGAMRVSAEVGRNQERAILVQSFMDLCRRNFEAMPGNARIELATSDSGRFTVSEMLFTDYPMGFTWPGVPAGSEAVVLTTEPDTRGLLRVKLQYLTAEELEERRSSTQAGQLGVELVIVEDVRALVWEFYDARTEEWETEWTDNSVRPSLVRLNLQMYGEDPIQSVFWIPTMADPQTITQAYQGGRGAVPGGGGPDGGAGGPGGPGGPGGGLPNDPGERRRALEQLRQQRGGGGAPPGRGDGRGFAPPAGALTPGGPQGR